MAADYSQLKKLDISETTEAEYTFRDIVLGIKDGDEVNPTAFFAPALDSNPKFLSEKFRIAAERAEAHKNETAAQRKKRLMSEDAENDEREFMITLLARTCARRWGVPLPDSKGKVHDLADPQAAYEFLSALPRHMVDPLIAWATNPYNFFDRRALLDDGETLGNS